MWQTFCSCLLWPDTHVLYIRGTSASQLYEQILQNKCETICVDSYRRLRKLNVKLCQLSPRCEQLIDPLGLAWPLLSGGGSRVRSASGDVAWHQFPWVWHWSKLNLSRSPNQLGFRWIERTKPTWVCPSLTRWPWGPCGTKSQSQRMLSGLRLWAGKCHVNIKCHANIRGSFMTCF